MSTNNHDLEILHLLIDGTIDSAESYAQAAGETAGSLYAEAFGRCAAERRQVVATLQKRARALGGATERQVGSPPLFADLRGLLGAGGDAVAVEVERGEDQLRTSFRHAMVDQDVSPTTRLVIADVYAAVRAGHERMRELERTLHLRA